MSVLAGSCGNAGFADGTLTQARFDHPTDVAVRERDGSIFLADSGNSVISWIRPDLDSVSTLAGTQGSQGMRDGPVASARFSNYLLLALIDEGLMMAAPQVTRTISDCPSLLVADMGNLRLRSIKLDTECENPSTPLPPLSPPAPPSPCTSMGSCDCAAARWTGRAEGALVMLALVLLACAFAAGSTIPIPVRDPTSHQATCQWPLVPFPSHLSWMKLTYFAQPAGRTTRQPHGSLCLAKCTHRRFLQTTILVVSSPQAQYPGLS